MSALESGFVPLPPDIEVQESLRGRLLFVTPMGEALLRRGTVGTTVCCSPEDFEAIVGRGHDHFPALGIEQDPVRPGARRTIDTLAYALEFLKSGHVCAAVHGVRRDAPGRQARLSAELHRLLTDRCEGGPRVRALAPLDSMGKRFMAVCVLLAAGGRYEPDHTQIPWLATCSGMLEASQWRNPDSALAVLRKRVDQPYVELRDDECVPWAQASTPLVCAVLDTGGLLTVHDGQRAFLGALIEGAGFSVDACDERGRPLLARAIDMHQVPAVEALLSLGADCLREYQPPGQTEPIALDEHARRVHESLVCAPNEPFVADWQASERARAGKVRALLEAAGARARLGARVRAARPDPCDPGAGSPPQSSSAEGRS